MIAPNAFVGQTVVITGGSSGIGKQLASDFLKSGANVTIVSHDPERLEMAFTELSLIASNVEAIDCDIRNPMQVGRMAEHILGSSRHVDILINNAGYAVYRPFEESSVEEILDILDVNLSGAMRCTKAFLPDMISRRSGRIVNISSIGGETIITPNAAYCAAKHGMVAWSKAIRYELVRFNIGVNVICPGHTKTNFHSHPTFRRRDPYRRKNSRSLMPEDVSMATISAILKNRAVTYVPWWQGIVAWSLNAFPFVTLPFWNWVTSKRITQLYEQVYLEKPQSVKR